MSRKRWRQSVGKRPHTVTVYERTLGGPLYIQVWNPTRRNGEGDWVRRSLGHRDKERAAAHAHEQHAKLLRGREDVLAGRMILARLLTLYRRHRTPRKGKEQQQADLRRIAMWTRFLGASKAPEKISMREWEAFIDGRRKGEIDPRRNVDGEWKPRPVRDRAIEADLMWLKAVLSWATKWRDGEGRYLLRENPVRGYEIPSEKNPLRPLATQDRYKAIRAVSDRVTMEVLWDGKREKVRSYVSELLDLANYTGRRLSAIRQLSYSDLLLHRGPHGSIRFRADTDKQGSEWVVPLAPEGRAAIDRVLRERPRIGNAFLFPAPRNPEKPVTRWLCDKWLRRAEELAGVEPLKGKLWHAYRAKFATEMVDAPDRVVAKLGGWKAVRTLDIYQQPGEEAMLQAIESRKELREVRG